MAQRRSYEESYRFLQQEGWKAEGEVPPIPDHPPRYDDETLGLEFFRTWVKEAKMENLTMPRTYFSRTTVSKTSFSGSDLTESVANWNDFEDVDFSYANLTRFDFRGCAIRRTNFRNALLKDADLRHCSFEDCTFDEADLTGAQITIAVGDSLALSRTQKEQISWQREDGPEPDGG